MTLIYVGSWYFAKSLPQRITSLVIVCIFCMGLCTLNQKIPLGLQFSPNAILLPFVLFIILFSGSILKGDYERIQSWNEFRLIVLSPIFEEFVFRSCILCFFEDFYTSLFIAPLYFGLAHLHNAKFSSWQSTMFQVIYSYLFGCLASLIILRTKHLISAVVSHVICNYFGVPKFSRMHIPGLILFIVLFGPLTEPNLY